MASPLTSEMNTETVEDNGPSKNSFLKHTVAQSKVALLTAGSNHKERMVDRKTRVALLSRRPTNKPLKVHPVCYQQERIHSRALGWVSDSFYCSLHLGKFLTQLLL